MRFRIYLVAFALLSAPVCLRAHTPGPSFNRASITFVPDDTQYTVRDIFQRYCSGPVSGTVQSLVGSQTQQQKIEDQQLGMGPTQTPFLHTGMLVDLNVWRTKSDQNSYALYPTEAILLISPAEADLKITVGKSVLISSVFTRKQVKTKAALVFTLKKASDGELYMEGHFKTELHRPPSAGDRREEIDTYFLCRLDPPRERRNREWGVPTVSSTHEADVDRLIQDLKAGKEALEGYQDIDGDGDRSQLRVLRVPASDTKQKIAPGTEIDPAQLTGKSREVYEILQQAGLKPMLGIRDERSLSVDEKSAKKEWEAEVDFPEVYYLPRTYKRDGPKLNIYVETDQGREQAALFKGLNQKLAAILFSKGFPEMQKGLRLTYQGPIAEYRNHVFTWRNGRLSWTYVDRTESIDNSKIELDILKYAEPEK